MPSGGAAIQKNGKFVVEQKRKVPIVEDIDILVVGGGMAGVGAAVAAGRMGLKTIIVEYFGCLGGNGTSGMVNNFCGYATVGQVEYRSCRESVGRHIKCCSNGMG
jgi:heterodisulfide reductase subunit A-like polyferredoxin